MQHVEYNPLGGLARLTGFESRSVSAENPAGEKGKGGIAESGTGAGAARDLGRGWKVSPSLQLKANSVTVLADICGEGAVRHIWMTPLGNFRFLILRVYWDGSETPSVECPLSDFFASTHISGTGQTDFKQVSSLAVCVNPRFGMNCYWEMPFRRRCRMTVENLADSDTILYYQIDYVLGEMPAESAYFHAQFRRVNPLPYRDVYTIADGIRGKGQYVGTYMLWAPKSGGWWGEGEVKFYIDDDSDAPTVCGTGTEDYFCGAYNFDNGGYQDFSTPYSGMAVIRSDNLYRSQMRFSLYRWHLCDPVYFRDALRVTVQALGWREGGRYLPLQDDISSVAFWYQDKPAETMPPLPGKDRLEIV